jgi:hypothetical protein
MPQMMPLSQIIITYEMVQIKKYLSKNAAHTIAAKRWKNYTK